jgi:hypothetical protein
MSAPDPAHYREPSTPHAVAPWNPRALRAFRLSLASAALVPTLLALGALTERLAAHRAWPGLSAVTGAVSAIFFIAALPASIACLVLGCLGARAGLAVRREVPAHPVPERGRGLAGAAVGLGVLGVVMQLGAYLFACLVLPVIGRGRQVRRLGRPALPPLAPGDAWAAGDLAVDVDPAARAALAARWRDNARTEHASVVAFARLTLDLLAVGAPPDLVAAAQRDALDEVRHAELCFALARAVDGRSQGPGAFPEAAATTSVPRVRAFALGALAVDSLIDGAINEGVSARIAAALARRCDGGAFREALRGIAADEGRHAAHGWDVVAWCAAEGGAPVVRALEGALEGMPREARPRAATPADEGAWERWGIHGHALEAEAYAQALADARARVGRLGTSAAAA